MAWIWEKITHRGEKAAEICGFDGVRTVLTIPEEIDGLAVGSSVSAGQVIGHVGDTALVECCDEPHLHLETTLSGVSVDPLDYVPEESIAASFSYDESFEG